MIKNHIYAIISVIILLLRIIFSIITIMAFSSNVSAQKSDVYGLLVWNLEHCINYAKENNLRSNSLVLEQKSVEQQLKLAKGARLPDLYISASQALRHSNTPKEHGIYGSGEYGAASSLTLYKGGYMNSDIRQKKMLIEAARLNLMQQQNDLTVQVMETYLNALLEKERTIYQSAIIEASAAQLTRAKNQFSVGTIALKQVMQLQAQLANDKFQLLNAQNAAKQNLVNLKQLLQLPLDFELDVVPVDTLGLESAIPSLRTVQRLASNNRPEIKNGELAIKVAEIDIEKARAGYKPLITLSGYLGSQFTAAPPEYFTQLGNNFNQNLGITVSIPLATRRINQVNVAQAKISTRQAQLRLKETQTVLSLTIERAYLDLTNAQAQFIAARQSFKFNQEAYRVADNQLNQGIINMVDYLQQRTLFIDAQQQYLQAKYNALLSFRIYEFYKG